VPVATLILAVHTAPTEWCSPTVVVTAVVLVPDVGPPASAVPASRHRDMAAVAAAASRHLSGAPAAAVSFWWNGEPVEIDHAGVVREVTTIDPAGRYHTPR
jgi:hypothetical protein